MIKMKIYRTGGEVLLAACDAHLIGKVLKEGELSLEVSSFYDGLVVDEKELTRHMRQATIANFVGERVVGIAIEEGFVDESCIMIIEGVPHAQMVMI